MSGFAKIGVSTVYGRDIYYSALTPYTTITNSATNKDFGDIVVAGLPAGLTIRRAVLQIKIPSVVATASAATALSGTQYVAVKLSTGTWGVDDINALTFLSDNFTIPASSYIRYPGINYKSETDIKAKITGNGTYNIRWKLALASVTGLQLQDVQTGLIIDWTV